MPLRLSPSASLPLHRVPHQVATLDGQPDRQGATSRVVAPAGWLVLTLLISPCALYTHCMHYVRLMRPCTLAAPLNVLFSSPSDPAGAGHTRPALLRAPLPQLQVGLVCAHVRAPCRGMHSSAPRHAKSSTPDAEAVVAPHAARCACRRCRVTCITSSWLPHPQVPVWRALHLPKRVPHAQEGAARG